jgi:hypothetical protein
MCTANRFEKFCNASRVTDNLSSSSVVDRSCVPYYSFPIHRDAIKGRLPVTLVNSGNISMIAGNQCISVTADLVGQRDPCEVVSIKSTVCSTEEEFRTGSSKLETKDRRGHDALGDESLE